MPRALACVVLACACVLLGCAAPASPDVPTEEETAQEQSAPNTQDQASPAPAEAEQESEPDPEPQPEPEPEPLVPSALDAGYELSEEEIERVGGPDAFFWEEEISDATFARMEGKSFGQDCSVSRDDLRYVRVLHADAEGSTFVGELVVNRRVADEVVDIFRQLYEARYPIRKMHLVDDYDASDEASCLDDNTSAFNFRLIAGTSQVSNHAYGLAIDINTYENPYYIVSTGHLWPPDGTRYLDRSLDDPYMIHPGDVCYSLFIEHGWSWGGNWADPHDYQHFEKPQALYE